MVKKRQTPLRVRGVVKAMNLAHERLSAGIPADERDNFRHWVHNVITQVDEICRTYAITPDKLSAPTYRAYQFLKSIDLDHLPGPNGMAPTQKKKLRISNLITICNVLQDRMGLLARGSSKDTRRKMTGKDINDLLAYIQGHITRVEQICRQEDAGPADLPARSRRAYQWLKFLGEAGNLPAHLDTLAMAHQAGQEASCRKKLPPAYRKLPVKIEFYNLPALYRTKLTRTNIQIVASEGFITAPNRVVENLVCAALLGKISPQLAKVRQYADSDDFAEILMAMELNSEAPEPVTRGQQFDLEEIFARVNATYFDDLLEKPRLTWNRTITHRKLGHYQPATDTVMISITLDAPEIPTFLIEYVMYHELLHKHLGIKVVNGRRYAHTHTFRDQERKFEQYAQAQEFLQKLGQRLAL